MHFKNLSVLYIEHYITCRHQLVFQMAMYGAAFASIIVVFETHKALGDLVRAHAELVYVLSLSTLWVSVITYLTGIRIP